MIFWDALTVGETHRLGAHTFAADDILRFAGKSDAAFAVSFSPYASETVAQAKSLAARQIPVVSLTDSAFSPLVESSEAWLELAEADHAGFRLLSASMAFAMALTVAVAEERQRRSELGAAE